MRRTPFSLGSAVALLAVSGLWAASEAPLADAAEHRNQDGVRALLEKRIDVNAAQVDGMTALHWAAYQDDLKPWASCSRPAPMSKP